MSNSNRSNYDSSRGGSSQGWGRPNNANINGMHYHEYRPQQQQPFNRGHQGGRHFHRGEGSASHRRHGQRQQRSIPRNDTGYYGPQQQDLWQRSSNNVTTIEPVAVGMSSNRYASDEISKISRKKDFSEMTDEELHKEFKEQVGREGNKIGHHVRHYSSIQSISH